ncbi:MAG TPA: tripartite tricarboxylate transporter substrate-binding protein, partial [Burkholderiales bacterium]|nr:tripartite tricarboxylate transporter substrate-binding protein [Burkholderiales bacterium]
ASPSGGLDIMARTVGQPLSVMWGQPVVVDNRPGAGIMLGTEMASKAAPDGYTLIVLNANLAPNVVLHDKHAVVKGLTGVIKIADLPNAMSVPASLPVGSMKELIAMAKTARLTYGSAGHGTVGNILTEMLKLAARVDITHVPYKGGGPVMAAVTGGQVSLGVVSLASTMAHMKAGRVKILGVSSSKRSRLAPDIPTIAETVPGVALESWVGMMAPAGTPPAIIRSINAAVLKAVEMPDVRKRLVSQGYDVQGTTPEVFNQLVQSDLKIYARVIREANIKIN